MAYGPQNVGWYRPAHVLLNTSIIKKKKELQLNSKRNERKNTIKKINTF